MSVMTEPSPQASAAPADQRPLVLDLDGTLLRTDMLWETAMAFLAGNPFRAFLLVYWALLGPATLKARLAARTELDLAVLPVRDDLVAFARAERAKGRKVVLATASDQGLAERVQAALFPFVSQVIGSAPGRNLKGRRKAKALDGLFPDGFDYAGDSRADLAVWRSGAGVVLAGASAGVARRAAALSAPIAAFPETANRWKALRKGLRLHQWAKNALVFAPLFLAHLYFDPTAWARVAAAFVALGLTASATYLLNDLFDLSADRRHWSKRNRPIASGALPIPTAVVACAALLSAGLALAAAVSPETLAALLGYLALTLGYSFGLKREPMADIFILGGLFTIRLFVGAMAAGAEFSVWLMVFSMFLFTSLSAVKRNTELVRAAEKGETKAHGRGYRVSDQPLMLAFGVAAALGALLVLVIYVVFGMYPSHAYLQPAALWVMPLALAIWLGRVWLLAQRGEMDDDPVAFAVKDRISLLIGLLMAVAFVLAVRPIVLWGVAI